MLRILSVLSCLALSGCCCPAQPRVQANPAPIVPAADPASAEAVVWPQHFVGDLLLARMAQPSAQALDAARAEVARRVQAAYGPGVRARVEGSVLWLEGRPHTQSPAVRVLRELRAQDARASAPADAAQAPEEPIELRVHHIVDVLRRMPRVQLVGPQGARTESVPWAFFEALHAALEPSPGAPAPGLSLHGENLVVQASESAQARVAAALASIRAEIDTL